ncbi:glycosyltransferase [Jejuia pallidilutea]|uniref:Sugar transferase n=3 Tax=Jejuia pallidilutea TaxID=504487 RepID=A0A090VW82_9FLAO|nr:glycosyltransferase [Jejuia pallidilutea]GAL67519.1 sugar transferase [Jejuia pallidilutea]GAL88707.1 sugar transferase [Jejuia pallidilutea]
MDLAPIALFTYKKLAPLKATVEALKSNNLAEKSELIVFSDGPKKESDTPQIEAVRAYIKTITGFKKITCIFSKNNKGLAKSILEGVTQILKQNETVIVLEDDLKTSINFLDFMNESLDFYKDNDKIISISGYTPPIKVPKQYVYDNYFTQRASSWGWATYRAQWEKVDWDVSDYSSFKNNTNAKRRFNRMGSDMSYMLSKQMKNTIDSWAIRWCYHQFKNNLYSVFPMTSKIENIGFTQGATHTKGNFEMLRFATPLDTTNTTKFKFLDKVELNKTFIKQFTIPYSLKTRIVYKLKGLFG